MSFRLFHYWRSSASWRVRWACRLKGIDVELVPVSLIDGESEEIKHRARHPLGRVPVLEVLNKSSSQEQNPTPPRFLIESVAILEYFEEIAPAPRLLPTDPWQRAQMRALVELINSGIHPQQNPSLFESVTPPVPAEFRQELARKAICEGLRAFQTLSEPLRGQYCVQDQITFADLCLVPQLYSARRFQVDLSPFAALTQIESRLLQTEACYLSHPDRYEPPQALGNP